VTVLLSKWLKRGIGGLVILLLVGAAVYALRPQPVGVDSAVIDRGLIEVTVDEEGTARIKDVFRVSAPVAGSVQRLPIRAGDSVQRGVSTIAIIRPSEPPFLDVRTRRELQAAAEAAKAAVELAESQLNRAASSLELVRANHTRAQTLAASGRISERAFDEASTNLKMAEADRRQAEANLALRQREQDAAKARLIEPASASGETRADACCIAVLAPINGVVLGLQTESEQVLPAGAALAEIGDPHNIEIVAPLLSADAVRIAEGGEARVDDWGGNTLRARVDRINPSAYTKVSALGIDEQRVDVFLNLTVPHDAWSRLGHEFRVMVHIPVWRKEDAVRIPLGALFRSGNQWQVYVVAEGRARIRPVTLGQRNNEWAELLDGLAVGEAVILHPSDRVADGARVEPFS
jgi:HlyD family secretion protein